MFKLKAMVASCTILGKERELKFASAGKETDLLIRGISIEELPRMLEFLSGGPVFSVPDGKSYAGGELETAEAHETEDDSPKSSGTGTASSPRLVGKAPTGEEQPDGSNGVGGTESPPVPGAAGGEQAATGAGGGNGAQQTAQRALAREATVEPDETDEPDETETTDEEIEAELKAEDEEMDRKSAEFLAEDDPSEEDVALIEKLAPVKRVMVVVDILIKEAGFKTERSILEKCHEIREEVPALKRITASTFDERIKRAVEMSLPPAGME